MNFELPKDWSSSPLRDISKVTIGLVTTMTQHYSESGIPLIRNSDIKENRITKHKLIKLTESFADQNSGRKLQAGDIVTVHTGEVGVSSLIDKELDGSLGFATLNTRVKQELVCPHYLCWYFNNPRFLAQCVSLSTGDGRQNLNLKDFAKVVIPLPPLPEQKKIAQILSTWDQAITATERLLENSQKRKKGLMQQLLTGKKRLPGFEGEWISAQLGDLVEINTGSSKAKFIEEIGDKYIIDMGSVTRTGRLVPTKKASLKGPCLGKGQLVMPKDDIGGGNIIGRVGVIPESEKFLLADHVYALTPHETDSQFLGYLINSEKVNKSLRRKANGTAQLGLGKKDVQKQTLFIPSDPAEQRAIGEILLFADQEFDLLTKRLDMLKQEKKALMQQLLTGKRRVRVDSEAA